MVERLELQGETESNACSDKLKEVARAEKSSSSMTRCPAFCCAVSSYKTSKKNPLEQFSEMSRNLVYLLDLFTRTGGSDIIT